MIVDKYPAEAAGGAVISGVAVAFVGVDVRGKFGDFRLNSGRIIRLFGRPYPFYALLCSI